MSAPTAPRDKRAAARAGAQADLREERIAELGLAFRRVFRTMSRLRGRDTHLAGTELSHAQFQLLIELYERGELPAGELAGAAQLAPGTVTQMLDGLAESGHVERVRSLSDRRVVVSRLTERGHEQIAAKRAVWQGRWEQALGDLDASDLASATVVLERLAAMFEQAPGEADGEASGGAGGAGGERTKTP
jgi:DNA-binding MarR family transcriptional regulator